MSALLIAAGALTMGFGRHSAPLIAAGAGLMLAGWLRLELLEDRQGRR